MEVKKDNFNSLTNRNKAVKMLRSNNWIVVTYEKHSGFKFNPYKLYCYIAVLI